MNRGLVMVLTLGLATLCRAPGFYTAFSDTRERNVRLLKPGVTGAPRRDGEAAPLYGAMAHVLPYITHIGIRKELRGRQQAFRNWPRSHCSSNIKEPSNGQQELSTAQEQLLASGSRLELGPASQQ